MGSISFIYTGLILAMATHRLKLIKMQPLMNYGFAFLQEEARLASISFRLSSQYRHCSLPNGINYGAIKNKYFLSMGRKNHNVHIFYFFLPTRKRWSNTRELK